MCNIQIVFQDIQIVFQDESSSSHPQVVDTDLSIKAEEPLITQSVVEPTLAAVQAETQQTAAAPTEPQVSGPTEAQSSGAPGEVATLQATVQQLYQSLQDVTQRYLIKIINLFNVDRLEMINLN